MKTKTRPAFAQMPRDYAALCRLHLPRPIRDKIGYRNTLEIAEAFAGFEEEMNADQDDYFDLLCTLIEDYESEHVKWPKVSGEKMLAHLLAEHGLNASDLSRLLGASRALGPMILRGERSITAEHARALGKHFGLPAGVFIE
ncbi:MAG: transcriptional regulator [Verrucomicrobiota bacterium]|nr:transcriptional regulator [Verrucomicrobiota bacterium]